MCCWSVGSEIISLPAQMCDVRSLRNNNASSNCSTDILKYVIKLQPLDQFMKFSLLLSSLENCMNPESLFLIFLVQKHQDNLIVIFLRILRSVCIYDTRHLRIRQIWNFVFFSHKARCLIKLNKP